MRLQTVLIQRITVGRSLAPISIGLVALAMGVALLAPSGSDAMPVGKVRSVGSSAPSSPPAQRPGSVKILANNDGWYSVTKAPDAKPAREARSVETVAPSAPPAQTPGSVKILVNRDGWYKVTKAQLEGLGFSYPLSSDPVSELPHLYKAGTTEVPYQLRPDSIEFYGQTKDTPSTDTETYWLVKGTALLAPPKIPTLPASESSSAAAASPLTTIFQASKAIKMRTFYYANALNGDEENWFGNGVKNGLTTPTISIDASHVYTTGDASLQVTLYGLVGLKHTAHVTLNGTGIGDMAWSGLQQAGTQTLTFPAGILVSGANTVTLTHPDPDTAEWSVIDKLELSYRRYSVADNDSLSLPVTPLTPVTVRGFSGLEIRMIDISNPLSPRELTPVVTEDEVCKPPNCVPPGREFHATLVPPPGTTKVLAFLSSDSWPQTPKDVLLDSPSNLHGASGARLLVISHGALLSSVQPLVNFRQSAAGGSWSVKAVDVQNVYDEFGGGAHGPEAIAAYLQYAKANYNPAPTHVLLVGDASHDPRGYFWPDTDLLPTMFVDDHWITGQGDDSLAPSTVGPQGLAVPSMAVGRLPARTAAEVTTMVNKIIAYQQRPIETPRKAFLVSDNRGSSDHDFHAFSVELKSTLEDPTVSPSVSVSEVIRNPADPSGSKAAVLTGLNSGPTIVNFFGHGSVGIWTSAPVFRSSDVPSLTNTNAPSLYLMMTCLNGWFTLPNFESLAETVLKADQGRGAVAVWASSGEAAPDQQRLAANKAVDELIRSPTKTLGQAFLVAKGAITDQNIVRNWTLFGDPTTTLR